MKQPISCVAIAQGLIRQVTALISVTVRPITHLMAQHRIAKRVVKLLVIIGLALLLIGWGSIPGALADVHFLKEADQWVYQAQKILPDTDGNLWEVTALKQMGEGYRRVYLRLMTQSQTVQLDAAQPLLVETESGQHLTAPNQTRYYFNGMLLEPNIGQYDIQVLLPQIKGERSLQLQLPTQEDSPIVLLIASDVLDEWMTVGICEYLICTTP